MQEYVQKSTIITFLPTRDLIVIGISLVFTKPEGFAISIYFLYLRAFMAISDAVAGLIFSSCGVGAVFTPVGRTLPDSRKTMAPIMPPITRTNTILMYFTMGAKRLRKLDASPAKIPTIRNGIPRPSAYVRSKVKAEPGCVAARPSIAPSAAPTQGVQPAANAVPKTNDVTCREENFFITRNLWSRSRKDTWMSPVT